MKKFPSIDQYRNVIKQVRLKHDYQGKDEEGNPVYKHLSDYPKLDFLGTVKLHGTNAAIVKYVNGEIDFQSRERVLTLEQDNAGFMLSMKSKNLDFLWEKFNPENHVAIYGEWCGKGIQKGVAISELPVKKFVIFGVKVDDSWVHFSSNLCDNTQDIYNVLQFPTYKVEIDFQNPELIQNKLIDLTIQVEEECPVGKAFGISGIGEGIVFTCVNDLDLKFKSKGEKHSSSKVTKLNSIDTESLEGINSFVELAVTENRLNQGFKYLEEMGLSQDSKSTGDFISWVVKDVLKEETDTIIANQLDVKKVKSLVAVKARMWYLNKV